MVRLSEISGLGSSRCVLPDGSVIEYDAVAEIEQMIAATRSKCARDGCRQQSVSGSMFCSEHLEEIRIGEGRR